MHMSVCTKSTYWTNLKQITFHAVLHHACLTAPKQKEQKEREAFLERLRTLQLTPEDHEGLHDVVALALGRATGSAVLKDLGMEQTPETAHRCVVTLHTCTMCLVFFFFSCWTYRYVHALSFVCI